MGDRDSSGWWDANENERSWWQSLARSIICSGPVPQHVAFVMDGNRRYARARHLGSVVKGHEKGFRQLAKILDWCRDFGVNEVTVYAFSIENFKRSDEEVDGLMTLAEEKFEKLLSEKDKLVEKQVRFRFLGNIALLSRKMRDLIQRIELETQGYTKGRVNVCMPYTSRDEITRSFELIRQGCQKGLISKEDIDARLIDRCLDSGDGCTPVDMLVRTSGEQRLSDFLLWQCSSSHVHFDDVLWPDFGFYNLCKAILSYQYYRSSVLNMKTQVLPLEEMKIDEQRYAEFCDWIYEKKQEAKFRNP